MATTITLNITDSNGTKLKTAKLLGDASCIKSIFPNFEDNKVTSEQFAMLQQISNKAGVAGVLEIEDLEPLQQAEYYGFNEYYDIEQTEKNGKAFYKITIKETPFYYPDPKAQNIVIDYNLEPGVLLEHNRELLESRYNYTGDEGDSYNHAKLKAGDVIYLPVEKVSFDSSPCGFFSRLVSFS